MTFSDWLVTRNLKAKISKNASPLYEEGQAICDRKS